MGIGANNIWGVSSSLSNLMVNPISGTIMLISCIAIWIYIIQQLITYFYYIALINEHNIVKIRFDIFFQEDIKIVELYRILSIHSLQSGIFPSLLNYGTITMKIQGSGNIVFTHMPQPKKIIAQIEALKEHATQERFSSET